VTTSPGPQSAPTAREALDPAARLRDLEEELARARDEKAATERSLRKIKAERDAVVRDAHRRVKNNLQVIASLLDMQRRRLRADLDPDAGAALVDSRNRIEAIAAIHDVFFRLRSFDRIDLGPYVRAILTDLLQFYGTVYAKVGVETFVDTKPRNLRLDPSFALPIGLIVTELVSNALRHAFPGERRGRIDVLLSRRGDVILLEVCDDGVGLPADFEARARATLGFTIVTTQVEQLDGELAFGRGQGTRIRIAFPVRRR